MIITSLAIVAVLAVVLFLIETRGDLVVDEVLKSINRGRSGKFSYDIADVTWLRRFPDVSVELRNVRFAGDADEVANPKPIIQAERVFAVLNLIPLILDRTLEVHRVEASRAELNIERNAAGELNITRSIRNALKDTTRTSHKLVIDIEEAALDSVRFEWRSPSTEVPFVITIHELLGGFRYDSGIISTNIRSSQNLDSIWLMGRAFANIGRVGMDANLQYEPLKKHIVLKSGEFDFQGLKLSVHGFYDHSNRRLLDLNFRSGSNEWALLKTVIQQDLVKLNEDRLKNGEMQVTGKVSGSLDDGVPQIEASIVGKNVGLNFPDNRGEISDLGFTCKFNSGNADDWSEASIDLSQLHANLPGGTLAASISVHNFKEPTVSYYINANGRIDGFDRIFKTGPFKALKGNISIESSFDGIVNLQSKISPTHPLKALVRLDQVSFELAGMPLSNIDGVISVTNGLLRVKDIQVVSNGTRFSLSGELDDAYRFILSRGAVGNVHIRAAADQLALKEFVPGLKMIDDLTKLRLDASVTSASASGKSSQWMPRARVNLRDLSGTWRGLPFRIWSRGEIVNEFPGVGIVIDDFKTTIDKGLLHFSGELALNPGKMLTTHGRVIARSMPLELFYGLVRQKSQLGKMIGSFSTEFDISLTSAQKPWQLSRLGLKDSDFKLTLDDGSQWAAAGMELQIRGAEDQTSPALTAPLQLPDDLTCRLSVPSLSVPGIGTMNLNLSARDWHRIPGASRVDHVSLVVALPQGRIETGGSFTLTDSSRLELDSHSTLTNISWTTITRMVQALTGEANRVSNGTSRNYPIIRSSRLNAHATLLLKPFEIKSLELLESRVDLSLADSLNVQTGPLDFQLHSANKNLADSSMNFVAGTLDVDSVDLPLVGLSSIRSTVEGVGKVFNLNVSSNIFKAGRESGTISIDFSKDPLKYRIEYDVGKIPVGQANKWNKTKTAIKGFVNAKIELSGQGNNPPSALNGRVSLTGHDLGLTGINVDRWLANYKKSQNFDLVDVTAFALAGPAGPVVTKGSQFLLLLRTGSSEQESTNITNLNIDVSITKGLITTRDVAFATGQNRIAVKGQIDVLNKNVPEVAISVVDREGCSLLHQTFFGPFKKIEHGKLNIAGTLTGSITNLASDVVGMNCQPFYTGAVPHPKTKN